MRAPGRPRPLKIYCGNPRCSSRESDRLFEVIDTTDMSAAERAELLIEGVDSFRWDEREDGTRERVQITRAKPRYDGELIDGEIWLCPDCRQQT